MKAIFLRAFPINPDIMFNLFFLYIQELLSTKWTLAIHSIETNLIFILVSFGYLYFFFSLWFPTVWDKAHCSPFCRLFYVGIITYIFYKYNTSSAWFLFCAAGAFSTSFGLDVILLNLLILLWVCIFFFDLFFFKFHYTSIGDWNIASLHIGLLFISCAFSLN